MDLQTLYRDWHSLSQEEQTRAYALVDVTTAERDAIAAEARRKAGTADVASRRWYDAHAFRIWLDRFIGQQVWFRQQGIMDKLKAEIEREAQMLRDAGLAEQDVAETIRRRAA